VLTEVVPGLVDGSAIDAGAPLIGADSKPRLFEILSSERCMKPTIRNLVLAGHSGAGVILSTQTLNMQTPICEVWGFDSLYGGENKQDREDKKLTVHTADLVKSWLSHAASRQDTKFFFHWGTSPLRKNATDLDNFAREEGLTNLKVQEFTAPPGVKPDSGEHHFAVLTANFPTRVKSASCFS
jgi:hypothetical protein